VAEKMNEVIGYCPQTLRKGNPESPLGNLTADGLVWMARHFFGFDADVSLYNSGGIRAEISKGNVTLGDVYAAYPFDNVLSMVTLKGRDLKTLFEHMAEEGGMPVNKGVKLVIDGNRVKSVTVNGKSVEDDKVYNIATIDYLVNTGRYGLDKILNRTDSAEMVRDYFGEYFRYLAAQNPEGHITASVDGRIVIE
jgi:2',3'-cyclic-nucleotide 2'-phosphodiesterase (5'-nucleotidase family)